MFMILSYYFQCIVVYFVNACVGQYYRYAMSYYVVGLSLVDEPPLLDVLRHAMMNEGWVTSLKVVSKCVGLQKLKTT